MFSPKMRRCEQDMGFHDAGKLRGGSGFIQPVPKLYTPCTKVLYTLYQSFIHPVPKLYTPCNKALYTLHQSFIHPAPKLHSTGVASYESFIERDFLHQVSCSTPPPDAGADIYRENGRNVHFKREREHCIQI